MSVTQIHSHLTRSFYMVVTVFFRLLLLVNVPLPKKTSTKYPASPKSEPDIPPPLLTRPVRKKKDCLLWQQIIHLRHQKGINVKPIKHRVKVLKSFKCPDCLAPIDYI